MGRRHIQCRSRWTIHFRAEGPGRLFPCDHPVLPGSGSFSEGKAFVAQAAEPEGYAFGGHFLPEGKNRPNRIGLTSVEIIAVTDDTLVVKGLDAVDGTPVLDIKPYYPVYDRKDATVPEWVDRLMEHYF